VSSAYVEIPLTRGHTALIDLDDYERVTTAGSWYAWTRPGVRTCYAAKATTRSDGGRTTIYLHTFLTGWPRVDHKNSDGLDNRRANLRLATQSQNIANARRSLGSSQFRGVHFQPRYGNWMARITVRGVKHYLGVFPDGAEAARAYDAAAIEMFGEFARPNFPQGGAA